MCEINKSKSCGCSKKAKLEEKVNLSRDRDTLVINIDNALQHSGGMRIQKQSDGTAAITVDGEKYYPVDDMNSLTAFMGNASENAFGASWPKNLYFQPETMDAVSEFFGSPTFSTEKNGLNEMKSKKITIIAKDSENTIVDLLNSIKRIGNGGHGFEIEMDKDLASEREESGIKTNFYWDGDGGDQIESISVEENDGDEAVVEEKQDNPGYLTPGINEAVDKKLNEYDDGTKEVLKLLIKHYRLTKKLDKQLNGKFTGFSQAEAGLNKQAQDAKNSAWKISRSGGIDTNDMMKLDKEAKVKAGMLTEASKVNLKLSSNAKRELIKKAKTALDAIYAIYDITERLSIDAKPFVDNLDGAFEGTNDLLTLLVTQESVEKK